MNEDDIAVLNTAIDNVVPSVWWFNGHTIKRCLYVDMDWLEKFSDGSFAEVGEPAVFFSDGTCAALWCCEVSEFVTLEGVFPEYD